MRRAYLALAAVSALAACAPMEDDMGGGMDGGGGGQMSLAAANPIGEPTDCINLGDIREARPVDNQTIDFRLKSGRIYRNRLPNACPDIRHHAFTYQNIGARLCSVDNIIVTSISPGVPGPTCGLGSFQEIDREVR